LEPFDETNASEQPMMSTSLAQEKSSFELTAFQEKCEFLNKGSVVLLAFMIPVSTVGTHIALSIMMLSWFLSGHLREKVRLICADPLCRMTWLLFAVYAAGSLYSVAPSEDIMGSLEKMSKLLWFPLVCSSMRDQKWRRYAINAFLGAMALTFFLSCLKVYGDVLMFIRYSRACIFKDHIYTSLMMALASFIVAHSLLNQTKREWIIALTLLLAAFIYYVFFMSEGRTGIIIASALLVLFCVQRLRFKGLFLGIMGVSLLIIFAALYSEPFQRRFGSFINVKALEFTTSDPTLEDRQVYLRETWQLGKQHLWFGSGTGSFKSVYGEHAVKNQLPLTSNPHSEYLNIFFQCGLFGLAALFAFFLGIYQQSVRLTEMNKWVLQGVLLAMMVGCLINSWLMDFVSGYLFILLIALYYGTFQPGGFIDEKKS
jgi:O-antigen ligase